MIFYVMRNSIYEVSYQSRRELNHKIAIVILIILGFSLIMTVLMQFFLFPVTQKSISMEPGVKKNSCILVSPLVKTPERGSLLLVDPYQESKSFHLSSFFIKYLSFFALEKKDFCQNNSVLENPLQLRRVLGMPGDTIYMKDYVLYVKPKGKSLYLTEFELVKKPYNVEIITAPQNWEGALGVKKDFSPLTLKDGEYFLLADKRCSSIDSRFWGTIKKSNIKGKVLFSYYPFDALKIF